MKTKKINLKRNILFNIVYQVVIVLSPLIVTPKISRVFGPDYIGVKSFSFSIVYYFAIFGVLGLDIYGQRRIAIEKDNVFLRSKTFWTIFCTRFILVFFSILGFLLYVFVATKPGLERIVFLLWLLYLIREMINPIWFLQGLERYQLLSVLGIASQIAYVACTVIFVKEKNDLPLYIFIYTAIPLFISICYFPVVFNNVQRVPIEKHEMLKAIKGSIVYFVPTIATAIYSMVDKTMLGFFDTQKISTGLYESAERLVKVALAFSTASFTIIRTRMSYVYANQSKDEFLSNGKRFISLSMMMCWPIMFGIIGIANDFVPVFFGNGFEEVVSLSYVFSLVVPCLTISGLLQAIYIFPLGLQKTMDIYYGIIVTINIIMNLVLISLLNTVGAIIASVFAEMLLAIILVVKARNVIEVSYIAISSIKYIISGIIMLFVMNIISWGCAIPVIYKVAVEFIVAVITYFLSCILLRDRFVCSQINSILRHMLKK